MLISAEKTYLQAGNPLAFRDNDEASDRSVNDARQSSIPPRYQDGHGGINIEQVKRDQRRARRDVVRAMMRRLANH